jgi:hypothetical protein
VVALWITSGYSAVAVDYVWLPCGLPVVTLWLPCGLPVVAVQFPCGYSVAVLQLHTTNERQRNISGSCEGSSSSL